LLLLAFPTGAQEEATETLNIQIQSSPANPIAGGAWTVTILADHPLTQEVLVQPPDFPRSLMLQRVRTDLRYVTPPAEENSLPPEGRRWTAVEFLFTLQSGGRITLEPFKVTVGLKQAVTGPISIQVREANPSPAQIAPSLRWERPPASLSQGRAEELSLVLSNWDLAKPIPRNWFRGKIPEKLILDELPFIDPGQDRTIRYPIRIIPLEGGNVILGSFQIQVEGETLEIPRLNLPVTYAPSEAGTLGGARGTSDLPPDDENEALDGELSIFFPKNQEKVFFFLQNEYDKVIEEARELWEQDRRAKALAVLRKNERDSLSGPFLVSLRRELDSKMGLSTGDEAWAIWNHPAFPWVCFFLFLLVTELFLKNRVPLRSYKSVIVLICLLILQISFLLIGLSGGFSSFQSRSAVLEETPAYRVPDPSGAVQVRFDEGQPVKIRSSSGVWIYAESIDGRSGWVPIEAAYPY
jgi:hypothetical protein